MMVRTVGAACHPARGIGGIGGPSFTVLPRLFHFAFFSLPLPLPLPFGSFVKTPLIKSWCWAVLCGTASWWAHAASPGAPAPAAPSASKATMQCYIGTSTITTRCPTLLPYTDVSRQAARDPLLLVGQSVSIQGVHEQPGGGLLSKSYAKDPVLPLRFICPSGGLPQDHVLRGTVTKTGEVDGHVVLVMNRCNG